GLLSNLQHWPSNFLHHVVFQLSTSSITSLVDDRVPAFGKWFDLRLSALLESSAATGQGITPSSLAQLMVALADLHPDLTLFDPACGIGTLLARAADLICSPRK